MIRILPGSFREKLSVPVLSCNQRLSENLRCGANDLKFFSKEDGLCKFSA